MKKILVSIIVPAYNEERHIKKCLLSIKGQTYPKIELVAINDGSTDATRKIAKRYADVFIEQKHRGAGVARNKAAMIAKGEILIFIDADMYLDKNFVKTIIAPIITRKAKATFTKDEYVANSKNIWSICWQINNNLPLDRRVNPNSSNSSNVFRAIKKNYFLFNGGYNASLGYEDDKFFNKSSKDNAIVVNNAICYHTNPEGISDVFLSARWIGRTPKLKKSLRNILRYSFINSLKVSYNKVQKGAPLFFIVFKLIFDVGMLSGILFKSKYYEK